MKTQMFLILLTAAALILSGCGVRNESLSESTQTTGDAATQLLPSPQPVKDTNYSDEFQAFIETWELSDLIPEDLLMTTEHQDFFMKYFQQFDDVTRSYVIMLLQGIAAGTITITNPYNNDSVPGVYCDIKNNAYLLFCSFCIFDMNGDGVSELIVQSSGDEAGRWYTAFTIIENKLIDCGGISGSHTSLYTDGSGKILGYAGHMGVYDITISELKGTTLITQEIASGTLNNGEQYPELEEYGYGDYNQDLQFTDIPSLLLAPAG